MPRFTREEAENLVLNHGSIRKAAKAAECSPGTIQYCLDPARRIADQKRYTERYPERRRKQQQDWYYGMTGIEWSAYMLRQRRRKALARMDKRNKQRELEAQRG